MLAGGRLSLLRVRALQLWSRLAVRIPRNVWLAMPFVLSFLFLFRLVLVDHHVWRVTYTKFRSQLPNTISDQYTTSFNRDAARIPRLLLSPSFIGISPEYVEKEFERDKAEHGADDYTVAQVSGVSPADAFKGVKLAQPIPDAREVLPQFRGSRCLSRYPISECPFPGMCPPAVPGSRAATEPNGTLPCAMWATGEPQALSRYLADEGQTGGKSALRDRVLDWDMDGQWKDDLWHPYDPLLARPQEKFHFYTPEEMHRCFKGKRIVFQGDSMVRQLFYRTVNYLRQLPTSVEHVFDWGTSSYQSFPNGTDKWWANCPDRKCTFPPEALYTIMFDWHNPWGPEGELKRLREYETDIVVMGWNYWLAGDFSFTPLRKELIKFFTGYPEDGWKFQGKFSWYMTPDRGPSEADHQEFMTRNHGMRNFVRTRRKAGQTNINALPNDYLTKMDNGRVIVRDRRPITSWFNDVHFMADFLESNFPEPLKPGLQYIKAPMDWDTRDVVNLNIIQTWLNGICEPTS